MARVDRLPTAQVRLIDARRDRPDRVRDFRRNRALGCEPVVQRVDRLRRRFRFGEIDDCLEHGAHRPTLRLAFI